MKIKRKIIILILVTLLTCILTSPFQVNILASSSINFNSRKIVNVAVIIHRMNDPFNMRLRESLENIAKDSKNNIKYTFFDSKNNIAIQNEILDLVLKGNYDLLILNLPDKTETSVENVINAVKPKDIPLILMNISQEVVSKVSGLYNKTAFIIPDSK